MWESWVDMNIIPLHILITLLLLKHTNLRLTLRAGLIHAAWVFLPGTATDVMLELWFAIIKNALTRKPCTCT